jgi:predicted small secreted protein
MTLENIQFIISVTTLIGFIIVVYKTFRDPDIKTDKSVSLLKDQIQYERKITDKAIETQQNCLHSLEKEVYQQREATDKLTKEVVKLSTIIEERIPKKVS